MTSFHDQVTRAATAFVSRMKAGYVPSLQRQNSAQDRLGNCLERLGYRVFWANT
jgi:hypothetical protein